MTINDILLSSFILSVISFILMAIDKSKASARKARTPEYTYFILTLFGGFLGVYIGGLVFRHKTKKKSFQLKIIIALICYVLLATFLYNN